MYRYQHSLVSDEALYIAGPECFYTYGYDALGAMKARAEALGFSVTLPNSDPLDMENPDLQKRADSIFANLEKVMLDTTAIVADLEAYRGAEPDWPMQKAQNAMATPGINGALPRKIRIQGCRTEMSQMNLEIIRFTGSFPLHPRSSVPQRLWRAASRTVCR